MNDQFSSADVTVCISKCKNPYRTFCNYAFYSPPIQTNYKSRKTQLRPRNVKWFAPLQTQTDRQMLEHTHTHSLLLHTHALGHIYTVLLSRFTSLSCLLSLSPFHAAVTGHFPTNLPRTCSLWQFTHVPETHSTHTQLWQVWSRCRSVEIYLLTIYYTFLVLLWVIHWRELFHIIHNLTLQDIYTIKSRENYIFLNYKQHILIWL